MVNAHGMKERFHWPIVAMTKVCTCESCISDYLYVYERRNVAGLLSLPVPASSEISREVGEDFYFWLQQNIHIVWIGTFYRLFVYPSNLSWGLIPYDSNDELPANNCIWGVTESAKVRFTCADCGKIWTSISALASFALCLEYEGHEQKWNLWFTLHGQCCTDCAGQGNPPKMHYGTWYPHEVFRVMKRVHHKIKNDVFSQMKD